MIDPLLIYMCAILLFGVILVNGMTDAPNAIATSIGTRALSLGGAVALATVFNFFGALVMTHVSPSVAESISGLVDFGDGRKGIIALSSALLGVVIWALIAWRFGIPTSESHALISGLVGSALALGDNAETIDLYELKKAVLGIVISVVFGFVFGFLICKGFRIFLRRCERQRSSRWLDGAQIFGASAMAFMHGAQDGQKFIAIMGIILSLGKAYGTYGYIEESQMTLVCSLILSLGTALGGKRIIKAVGIDMVKLDKYQGVSSDAGAALSLAICSFFGFPVSTTQVKSMAIVGVGKAGVRSRVDLSIVKEIMLTWIFTFPACAMLSFLFTKLFFFLL